MMKLETLAALFCAQAAICAAEPPPDAVFKEDFFAGKAAKWNKAPETIKVPQTGEFFAVFKCPSPNESNYSSVKIPAEKFSGKEVIAAAKMRAKDLQISKDFKYSGAKFWLEIEDASGKKTYLTGGDVKPFDWAVLKSSAFKCGSVKSAELSAGLQKCAGELDIEWLLVCEAKDYARIVKSIDESRRSALAAEIKTAKNAGAYAALQTLEDFKSLISSNWGLGGAAVNYSSPGEYAPGFMRRAQDPERGAVGEVCFPKSSGCPWRELNLIMRKDSRIRQFSMMVKRVSGEKKITVSVYSAAAKAHFTSEISLPDKWERRVIHLSDMKPQEVKNISLTPDLISNFQFAAGDSEAVFLIDELVSEGNRNFAGNSVFISRELQAPWAFDSGSPAELEYIVSSASKISGGIVKVETGAKKIEAPAEIVKGVSKIKISAGLFEPGYHKAEVSLWADGKLQDALKDNFIVCSAKYSSAPPLTGVNISPNACGPGQFKSLSKAGIKSARVWHFVWSEAEPMRGQTDFRSLDDTVQWASEAGLEILPILQSPPAWAITPPDKSQSPAPWMAYLLTHRPPADLKSWESFAEKIAARYKGRVQNWEIWNEPDWQGPSAYYFWGGCPEYFKVLETAAAGLKKADPSCKVISGGISRNPKFTNPEFTRELVSSGAIRAADIYGIHAYITKESGAAEIKHVRDCKPDMPVWQTEAGAEGEPGSSPAAAEKMRKFIEHYFSFLELGVSHYSFFIVSPGGGIYDLLNDNGSPAERLAGICAAARMLHGISEFKRADTGGLKLYTFNSDKGFCAAVFGKGRLTLSSDSNIVMTDALGFEKNSGKAASVEFSGQPVYFHSKTQITAKAPDGNL